MNKKQWQEYHGFSDDTMANIEYVLKGVIGTITKIWDTTKNGKWGDRNDSTQNTDGKTDKFIAPN